MEIRNKNIRGLVIAFLALHALACLLPLIWLFTSSFKSNPEFFYNPGFIPKIFSPQNYSNAWIKGKFGNYFMNTVFYTVSTIIFVNIFASLAAYSMAKLKSLFVNIAYYLIIITIMIPAPGSFVQIFTQLQNLHLLNTRTGYIMVMIAANLPTSIFIMKGFFDSIPNEIVESAKMDGANSLKIWSKIALPLSTPALATVSVFTMLSVWNEYIISAITFSDQNLMPIQQGLLTFQGQYQTRYDYLVAATAITVIPMIAAYIILNKQVLQGATQGAVKG